jgi:uroporphyrinogen-III synthase
MRTWLAAAEAWDLDRALLASLGRARIAARGPKAAGALQQLGLPIWRLEPSERLATMIETLDPATLDGANVVLQEYGEAAPWAEAMLAAAGARVTVVPVYRCAGPADRDPALRLIEATVDGRLDAITFTSPPAARTFMRLAGEAGMVDALQDALRRVVVAAVGPMTAEALAAEGVDECIAPSRGRLGLMVRCLTDALSQRSHHVAAAGATVTVQGAVVARGNVRVELSERERAVLHVLLRRPGAVVSKDVLLREVWRGDGSSHKNVESTVGRLRRRLAPAGLSISALARRGYRLETVGAAG